MSCWCGRANKIVLKIQQAPTRRPAVFRCIIKEPTFAYGLARRMPRLSYSQSLLNEISADYGAFQSVSVLARSVLLHGDPSRVTAIPDPGKDGIVIAVAFPERSAQFGLFVPIFKFDKRRFSYFFRNWMARSPGGSSRKSFVAWPVSHMTDTLEGSVKDSNIP